VTKPYHSSIFLRLPFFNCKGKKLIDMFMFLLGELLFCVLYCENAIQQRSSCIDNMIIFLFFISSLATSNKYCTFASINK